MTIVATRVEDGSPITLDPAYFGDNAEWRALCAEVQTTVERNGLWFGYDWEVWEVIESDGSVGYHASGPA